LDRTQLLCCLLEALEAAYAAFMTGGAAGIMDRWNRYSILHDQKVRISTSRGPLEGWVQGLTAGGALMLRRDDGTMQTVFSGDVEVIEA
jgi:BirA family biotin operon repressor/biotin-[acetyl-CoA-carboxylase] ligase